MNKRMLARIIFRSFFIQGTWNFERMQNLGFCYAILPLIKKIYETEVNEPLKRHLQFFNTHPYMASPIIGAVAQMEEDVKEGKRSGDDINIFKSSLMGTCGAIGDSFFWGALKPFTSVFALCLAALGQIIAPFLFLLVYNVPHLWVRVSGLIGGYRKGEEVYEVIAKFDLPRLTVKVRAATPFFAGLLMAIVAHEKFAPLLPYGTFYSAAAAIGLFLTCFWVTKRGVSKVKLIYAALFLSIGTSYLL